MIMSLISRLKGRLRVVRNQSRYTKESFADFQFIEKKTGYLFRDLSLLDLALTHPSFNLNGKNRPSNQRLEFLGDSILGAVLSDKLYQIYPGGDEGSLSRKKAFFAQGSYLAELGLSLGLDKVIKMSPTEIKNAGNLRLSTLEDAVESLVGAIYLDGGFKDAQRCVIQWIGDLRIKLEEQSQVMNPKGKLQEIVQAKDTKKKIRYKLLEDKGPDHQKTFLVSLIIGEDAVAEGKGKSKKEAESQAAEKAIRILTQS